MSSFPLIILAAAVALGILVIGMSLTLIFKGRHMRSEIGSNPDMRRLGIKCTADEMRRMENCSGKEAGPSPGCAGCSRACLTRGDVPAE